MKTHNNKRVFSITMALASAVLLAIIYIVTLQTSNATSNMFTGAEHHQVTIAQAQRWTSEFQKTATEGEMVAGYFGKNIFEKILSQDGAVGVRIYKAKHDNGDDVFVLVGVDDKGKDIAAGVVGEGILPCPPICDPNNILMTGQGAGPLAMK